METINNFGFSELNREECYSINGGSITLGTVLFVCLGVKVTVGMCLSAGAAIGLVAGGAVVLSN